MIELQKVSEDARGEIYVLKDKGIEIASLEGYNTGAPRGGHHHLFPETKTVIYGKLEYWRVNPRDINNEIKSIISKGERICVEPGLAHLFVAQENSLLFVTREGGFEVTMYPPYRKIVDDYLAQNKNDS